MGHSAWPNTRHVINALANSMRSGVAGPTRLRIVRRSSSAALRFSFFLPTNSGRNNDPDKLFLVHGAGATMCVGELHEAITHDSFNDGADDCCRSVAHNSCPRLGLGLARRMGMGRCRTGACLSVLGLCRLPRLLRLWFRLTGLW